MRVKKSRCAAGYTVTDVKQAAILFCPRQNQPMANRSPPRHRAWARAFYHVSIIWLPCS